MEISKTELLQRFTAYAEIDTASDDKSTSFPSSAKELDLAKYLTKELTELGFSDVEMTEYGYVLATVPANGVGCRSCYRPDCTMDTSCEAAVLMWMYNCTKIMTAVF